MKSLKNKSKHNFYQWLQEHNYTDVRFYPTDNWELTAQEILDDACNGLKSMELGDFSPYIDYAETFLSDDNDKKK